MTKQEVLNKMRVLQLHINYGVGTVEDIEDAQVQLDMYIDILDDLNQE